MEQEFYNYKLRVPSQMDLVTTTNIRKFIGIIHQLPDTFQNSDIANIKEFPLNNEDAIARLLAYFKYLGILSEERTKGKNEDKEINIQYFHLTDVGKDLKKTAIYEPDNLNTKWIECLKKSELFKALLENEEFKEWNHISKTNLRKLLGESFSKKVKDAKERIDSAEEYLINFVKEFNLFTYDGTYLKPVGEKSVQEQPIEMGLENIKKSMEKESSLPISKGFTYIKDDNFELKIRLDTLSLKLLEEQVKFLKTKLESMNNEQKNVEKQ